MDALAPSGLAAGGGARAAEPALARARSRERVRLAALVALLLVPYVWAVEGDPDLFWHVRTGQLVLASGAAPETDPWSYTHAGARWTDHEWLSDALQGWLWQGLGNAGLLLLRDAQLALAVSALAALCWRRCPRLPLLALALASLMPFLAGFLGTRPHSFTYALLPLLLLALERARERPRWLWAAPLLVLAWVNLHGGFLLGWGVALCGIGSQALGLDGRPRAPLRLALGAGLAVLIAPLGNAYGAELLGYVLREMGARHLHVTEWLPPTGALWWLWGAATALPLLLLALGRRRPRAVELATFLLVAAAATRHAKFLVLVVLVGLPLALGALDAALERLAALRRAPARRPLSTGAALALAAAIGAANLLGNAAFVARHRFGVGLAPERWPVQAVAWLREHETGPRLLCDLTWGNLALWHLAPERRVALDGRNTAVYEPAWVDRYLAAWVGGDLDALLALAPADALLLPSRGALFERARARPEWALAFHDPLAAVFVPASQAPRAPALLASLPASVEFPGR